MNGGPAAERTSERELMVARSFKAPAPIVFEAWTRPDLFRRWWAPRSFGVSIVSCELDVRTGGTYHLMMGHPSSEKPMAFFGRYIDVTPHSRLVWTNDEAGEAGAVTTVSFANSGDGTLLSVHEIYPSKDLVDEATASGSTSCWGEQFQQLDEILVTLGHA